ncbi:hypothetical protein JD844_029083 [Phrynosoma platyrhinos]|uniref:C-type lectin domain-containing protein n=1 Tax=Phrynosoma platyrhinos TaxID=52577 RepID=A0ABQ7SIR0_PHRPL|nr:hypothetical protein JD844_029083 [Phrynosoma platyrhinos]
MPRWRGNGKMRDQTSFSLILCGFFLLSLFLKEAESCRRGWLVYQGFCYGLFNDMKTWADAEVDCHSMGAHLASIHSTAESSKVAEYVSAYSRGNKNVWIGMHIDATVSPPLCL